MQKKNDGNGYRNGRGRKLG